MLLERAPQCVYAQWAEERPGGECKEDDGISKVGKGKVI